MMLKNNLRIVGCDINPLANLITKVKLNGINLECIDKDIDIVENALMSFDTYAPIFFPNMNKWFRSDMLETLSRIKGAILKVKDIRNRLYFWSILSGYIRKYSNSRSSTYKLHIKPIDKILSMKNNLITKYIDSIKLYKNKYKKYSSNHILYKNDILHKITDFSNREFDLSITSPPYGDNSTTVPYGEFSILSLFIIPSCDLELEGWELDNYSIIDSMSLGGRYSSSRLTSFESNLIGPYINKISLNKQKKVIRFFSDYFMFLSQLSRVTKKYIVLTLGNRTVDRVQINLTEITKQFLEDNYFKCVGFAQRDIPIKRTPRLTSYVYNSPVSSMTQEFILVHKHIDLL